MKLTSILAVVFAVTASLSSAVAAPKTTLPLNYNGKSIYLDALNEIVESYGLNCTTTSPTSTLLRFHSYVEKAECHSTKTSESGSTTLKAVIQTNMKSARLRSLKLDVSTSEVLRNSEEMVGETVLTRVLKSIESNYNLSCKQGHDSMAICSMGDQSSCLYQMRFDCGDRPEAHASENGMKVGVWVETGVGGGKTLINKIVFHPYGNLKE